MSLRRWFSRLALLGIVVICLGSSSKQASASTSSTLTYHVNCANVQFAIDQLASFEDFLENNYPELAQIYAPKINAAIADIYGRYMSVCPNLTTEGE